VRLAGDVARAWGSRKGFEPGADLSKVLEERLRPLAELSREFRREGFYERFPARGQVERVERIRRRLDQVLGIAEVPPERALG
jgi:hypothetical protein